MPQQIYCSKCTERTFYVMMQNNGNISVFCAKNNHERVLVNLLDLIKEIYGEDLCESGAPKSGGSEEATRDEATDVQTQVEIKPAIVLDGPLGRIDD